MVFGGVAITLIIISLNSESRKWPKLASRRERSNGGYQVSDCFPYVLTELYNASWHSTLSHSCCHAACHGSVSEQAGIYRAITVSFSCPVSVTKRSAFIVPSSHHSPCHSG